MKTGAEHVREALAAWMERDGDAVLIGESVGRGGGNAGTCSGLLDRFGPRRVVDTPIADRTALGLAIGMAIGGRSVAVELSSTRALLATAEMLADAGRIAGTAFRPALTIRVPIGGEAGDGIDPTAGDLLAAIPGIRLVCLTAATASAVLEHALGSGVTVVLEPRAELARRAERVATGTHRIVRDGHHVTVLAWGSAVAASVEAADRLADDGVSVRVVDVVTLSPLDPAVVEQVVQTGRVVAAHPEDSELARRVLRIALDGAFLYLESPPSDCAADADTVLKTVRDSVHY